MRRPTGDTGFTLIETVVAMLVFALLSSGVIASTITISRMTSDNRARIVATNLAAQATDAVRLTADPFQVKNSTTTQTVSGRTYTVARTAAWVTSSGADATCGVSTALLYKRVTVTVTWQGQAITTQPVRSDTLLASTSKVTDASTGAIIVNVQDVTGAGESGVTATIAPGNALASQPAATDTDGCTYATTVSPGTYTVTLAASGHLDNHQVSAPFVTVPVTAGSTAPAAFQYDAAGTYTIVHAANASTYTPATPLLPTNLVTTLLPAGSGTTVWPVLTSNAATTALAWPLASGYSAIAGAATDMTGASVCASFNPGAWPSGTAGTTALAAGAGGVPVVAGSGGSATVREPMAVVTVTASAVGTLTATPANPLTATAGGNPGCSGNASAVAMTFGQVLVNGTITIALPYGAWVLKSSTDSALTSAKPISNTVGGTTAVMATTSGSVKTIPLVLDPRRAS